VCARARVRVHAACVHVHVCECVCVSEREHAHMRNYYIKDNITNNILYLLYYVTVQRCTTLVEQLLET